MDEEKAYYFKVLNLLEHRHRAYKRTPANELPIPRSGHRLVADEENLYSFGGYNPSTNNTIPGEVNSRVLRELWKYNIASNKWALIEAEGKMPTEAASHTMAIKGDYLLVYGGTGEPFGEVLNNDLNIYSIKENKWSLVKTTGSIPPPLYGQAIAIYDDHLYVCGGTTGRDFDLHIHKLDLSTKKWTQCCSTPPDIEGRYRHEIAIYKGKLYVIGGGTSFETFSLINIPVFDLETQTWSLEKTYTEPGQRFFPRDRKFHSLVQKNELVYISGGTKSNINLKDMWELNLEKKQWRQLPVFLETPLFFHSAALSEDGCQMFIFGGVTVDNRRTSSLYSIWLEIPKLKEIAFQALNKVYPLLNKNTAQKIGIPPNYTRRYLPVKHE